MPEFVGCGYRKLRSIIQSGIKERSFPVHFNIGNTHRNAGRYEEAEGAYLKALQLQPDYSQACFNLAATYESMKKPEEAIHYYEEFLKYWKGESVIADNARAHIEQLRRKPAKP